MAVIKEEDIKPSHLNNLCDELAKLSDDQLRLLDFAIFTVQHERAFKNGEDRQQDN